VFTAFNLQNPPICIQQQQLPNISRIRGVWGDPGVHDLTPTRTSHVKRSFPTDPQKTFLKPKKKNPHFAKGYKQKIKSTHMCLGWKDVEKLAPKREV